MPPRGAPCLRTARPASASTVRTLHISATLHKELPSNIFSASRNTNHSPFSPRAQTAAAPSAKAAPAATPSKFNLLNHSIKRAAPRTFDSAYRFSSIKPSPNLNWGINVQQNRATEFRIVNPVVVDKNDAVDEEELGKLIEENSRQYSSPAKHRSFDPQLAALETRYSLPLIEGQSYTHHDLGFATSKDIGKMRQALNSNPVDPFEKLNIDPFWEFKNYSLLSHFVSSMGRMLPSNRTGCSTRNQRRLGKAIRRSRALGFLPIWSRHPSLFEGKQERQSFMSRSSKSFM